MSKLPDQPLPGNPRRIVLLNPSKYLGNLLLAGGLIQDFAALCRQQDRTFLLVLDAAFRELCAKAFPDIQVLYYPRQELRRAKPWRKLHLFLRFLSQLRQFRADLAFNIEEDSLTSRLTQLSGARFRLGCSPARHRFAYEHVLPVTYVGRPPGRQHRWYSFQEVFSALGLPATARERYINLHIDQCSKELLQKLGDLGWQSGVRLVAIHPSATKDYKKWPEVAFKELCNLLINKGFTPALIGAGKEDEQRCAEIMATLSSTPGATALRPLNLCNQLSLGELAAFFRLCTGIVGNDSGPSHLASAQEVPGIVIFGPSEPTIWGPLGPRSRVLRKAELCDPRCSRRACFGAYRCLREITPTEVLDALTAQIAAGDP